MKVVTVPGSSTLECGYEGSHYLAALPHLLSVYLEISRLMTSEFLKKSGPTRRSPSAATSSHYLGTLKVLDQKPSRKQSLEPDKADHIRATVYQVSGKHILNKSWWSPQACPPVNTAITSKDSWMLTVTGEAFLRSVWATVRVFLNNLLPYFA